MGMRMEDLPKHAQEKIRAAEAQGGKPNSVLENIRIYCHCVDPVPARASAAKARQTTVPGENVVRLFPGCEVNLASAGPLPAEKATRRGTKGLGRGGRATWAAFEQQILLPTNAVALRKMEPSAVRIGGGKMVAKRGPCDFWGVVKSTPECKGSCGRMIILDAKECGLQYRFPVGNDSHFPLHQRMELVAMGREGAVAGLLVHANHTDVGLVLWLPWQHLVERETSIEWADPRWLTIGESSDPIDWEKILTDRRGGSR
jgi:hypothetical protein